MLKKHVLKTGPVDKRENEPAVKAVQKISKGRLWLFRLCAAVALPLILLGGMELILRLCHYGYPVSFFLETKIEGRSYYVPNEKFGYRFFPPSLARTPLNLRLAAQKSTNTFRIFVFGESAAQGDPDPTFGAWRYLQVLLHERFPGTDFEVVCVAMTAINSHVILPIARECAGHDGDLWIIYMGNNEMVGPFGAGTVFGARAPDVHLVRAELALKATRTGQLLADVMQKWGIHSSAPKTWSGLDMFKNQQLDSDDPARLRAYENFKINLTDILRAGQNAGVPVILSTVGSNLKDCAPFGSLPSKGLSEIQTNEWGNHYEAGITLESAGDYQDALKAYATALAIDSRFAELPFRMGECDLALTNLAAAADEFKSARDEDTLAFRADTRINQAIKTAADANAQNGVHFLDAVQILDQESPAGISGNELFYEHVHLNFAGNYLLGRAFAKQTMKLLPPSILARDQGAWAAAEFCDQQLAVSPWDRSRVWQQNFSRVSEPPFTGQLNDAPRARFYMAKLKELGAQMTDEARRQSISFYEAALAAAPADVFLHGNFSQFRSETGDLPGAIKEQKKVDELIPQTAATLYRIGTLLIQSGQTDEAQKYFSQALAVDRNSVTALNEIGLILANQGKVIEAAEFFARAVRVNPGYFETYLNWGFMEECQEKLDAALAHYQTAAELQPNGPATYFYHAVLAATDHKRDDAITYFKAAVWMNPKFWQARYLLGSEFVAEDQVDAAREQFATAAVIRPDFARAHLNAGVALAKLGKLDLAQTEFQAALKLDPADAGARKNLAAVEAGIQQAKAFAH
jgi:tetratricopeptide (TPR) repeat protein